MNYFQIAKQTSQKKPAHQQAKEKTAIQYFLQIYMEETYCKGTIKYRNIQIYFWIYFGVFEYLT